MNNLGDVYYRYRGPRQFASMNESWPRVMPVNGHHMLYYRGDCVWEASNCYDGKVLPDTIYNPGVNDGGGENAQSRENWKLVLQPADGGWELLFYFNAVVAPPYPSGFDSVVRFFRPGTIRGVSNSPNQHYLSGFEQQSTTGYDDRFYYTGHSSPAELLLGSIYLNMRDGDILNPTPLDPTYFVYVDLVCFKRPLCPGVLPYKLNCTVESQCAAIDGTVVPLYLVPTFFSYNHLFDPYPTVQTSYVGGVRYHDGEDWWGYTIVVWWRPYFEPATLNVAIRWSTNWTSESGIQESETIPSITSFSCSPFSATFHGTFYDYLFFNTPTPAWFPPHDCGQGTPLTLYVSE